MAGPGLSLGLVQYRSLTVLAENADQNEGPRDPDEPDMRGYSYLLLCYAFIIIVEAQAKATCWIAIHLPIAPCWSSTGSP